jgi:hypothetical protein
VLLIWQQYTLRAYGLNTVAGLCEFKQDCHSDRRNSSRAQQRRLLHTEARLSHVNNGNKTSAQYAKHARNGAKILEIKTGKFQHILWQV